MPNALAKATEQRYTAVEGDALYRTAATNGVGFQGHAAMFNRRTWIGPKRWGFWEQVAPGAFTKSISDGADVRFLINHDGLPLARTTNGTLRLSEDSVGLLADADLADTSDTRDLAVLLERGDVSQMSFAFEVVREEWETLGDDTELRTIVEAKLWDVSAVTYPAYEDTDAGLRAVAFDTLAARMGLTTTKRSRLIAGLAHTDQPTPEALAILRSARDRLSDFLDETAPASATPSSEVSGDPAPDDSTRGVPLSVHQRRHRLVASRHGLATSPEGTPRS